MFETINSRLLWTLNLLVIAVGIAIAATSIQIAGSVIEQRLVYASVSNAAELIEQLQLPLSPRLLNQLQKILGSHLLAIDTDTDQVLASSLTPAATAQVMTQARQPLGKIDLDGNMYRVGIACLQSSRHGNVELLLLAPRPWLQEARRQAVAPIAAFTVLALSIATVIGLVSARSISRPIQRLAQHMHALTISVDEGADVNNATVLPPNRTLLLPDGSARELQHLNAAFQTLLEHLHQAQSRLAETARLATVGKISAALAHEIRNPLSAIKMNARVMLDDLHSHAAIDEQALQLIMREIERLDLALRDLLQLARGAVTIAPPPPPVNIEHTLAGLQNLLAGRRQVQWHIAVADDAAWVNVAEAELRQILLNLVLNGIDAMAGVGCISCRACRQAEGLVSISISDTGSGLDANAPGDIFAPFVSSKPHGIGLGLYICRQMVQGWGGTITAVNAAGGGAVFSLTLPAASAPTPAVASS